MTDNLPQTQSEILIYQTEDGRTRIDVRLEDETVWLSQKLLAELFQKDVRTINEHVKNIYAEGELEPQATIRKFRMVQTEGKRQVARQVDFYNLDDERLKQVSGGKYFAELQALNRKPMYMKDWTAKLDEFLRISDREIL